VSALTLNCYTQQSALQTVVAKLWESSILIRDVHNDVVSTKFFIP